MALNGDDILAIGIMLVGAILMGLSGRDPNMGTEIVRTASYQRMVRKKTKKDRRLKRLVDTAEESISRSPGRGDTKPVFTNDTTMNRLAREIGATTLRSVYVMKQRYQIVYVWDQETGVATLLAFGTHKDLFRGNSPYSP